MYGVEPVLSYGPPAFTLGILVITPIFYSIPFALVNVDLSVAYPSDGGIVTWIDMAYHKYIGAHNMYW